MANFSITHDLVAGNRDFSDLIARHSGDKTVAYKILDGEEIRMSFFFPDDYSEDKKYPCIVYIHGGGWTGRDIFPDQEQDGWQGDQFGFLARHHSEMGYLGISIDYRMERHHAEGYQIIDCCDDCIEAMDYILDRAEEYHIDTERVYVLGESAGGHLAAYIAVKYKREGFKLKGAFCGNPVMYFEGDPDFEMIPSSSTHPVWAKMDPKDYAKSISPLCLIDKDTAPCILLHGNADSCVIPRHSQLFYDKMCELGLDCELHWIDKTNHAFMLAEVTDNLDACRISVEIVDDRLKRDEDGK